VKDVERIKEWVEMLENDEVAAVMDEMRDYVKHREIECMRNNAKRPTGLRSTEYA